MKTIDIPSPITATDPATQKPIENLPPITFAQFFKQCLMADTRWIQDLQWMRSGNVILDTISKSEGSQTLLLRNEDFEKLCEVVKTPRNGYTGFHPLILPQLLPFLEAIVAGKEAPASA